MQVDPYETPEGALSREMGEELNIKVSTALGSCLLTREKVLNAQVAQLVNPIVERTAWQAHLTCIAALYGKATDLPVDTFR